METIQQVIDRSNALAEKLMSEHPGMIELSFEFKDFPLDEIKAYAKAHGEDVKFLPAPSRFGFVVLASHSYIHIRSVVIKARLVYDEVETELTTP